MAYRDILQGQSQKQKGYQQRIIVDLQFLILPPIWIVFFAPGGGVLLVVLFHYFIIITFYSTISPYMLPTLLHLFCFFYIWYTLVVPTKVGSTQTILRRMLEDTDNFHSVEEHVQNIYNYYCKTFTDQLGREQDNFILTRFSIFTCVMKTLKIATSLLLLNEWRLNLLIMDKNASSWPKTGLFRSALFY